jgi:hypothetical protein
LARDAGPAQLGDGVRKAGDITLLDLLGFKQDRKEPVIEEVDDDIDDVVAVLPTACAIAMAWSVEFFNDSIF